MVGLTRKETMMLRPMKVQFKWSYENEKEWRDMTEDTLGVNMPKDTGYPITVEEFIIIFTQAYIALHGHAPKGELEFRVDPEHDAVPMDTRGRAPEPMDGPDGGPAVP